MRLTYPGRSSTTDDPDDPVRRRVLPDGRLDPISINSYNDAAVDTRRTCGLFSPLVELFFLSNLDEPSVTCFSNDIRYARIVPFVCETILFFPSFFLFLASSLSTRSAHRREKFLLFPRTLAPTIELSRESLRESLFSFLVPLFFSQSLSMSLSLSLSFSARACVRIRVRAIFFLFIPFLSPLSPSKITATPHRTEVNYSCAAGSRYLKYLGSRAAATAAATAAARHRHHRCASCGPLPQTRPTPRAPIGEGEEPMCARRLHRTILSSSLCVPCFPVSLSFSLPPPSPLYPWIRLSLSLSRRRRRRSPPLLSPRALLLSFLSSRSSSSFGTRLYPFIPYYLFLSLFLDSFLPIGWQWSITELLLLLLLLLVRFFVPSFFRVCSYFSRSLSPFFPFIRFLRIVF